MIVNTDINVEVEVLCDVCGKSLGQTDTDVTGEDIAVKVETCDTCTSEVYDDAYTTGFDKGLDDALSEKIDEALKDFDFEELFKQSTKYAGVEDAVKYLEMGDADNAQRVLESIM